VAESFMFSQEVQWSPYFQNANDFVSFHRIQRLPTFKHAFCIPIALIFPMSTLFDAKTCCENRKVTCENESRVSSPNTHYLVKSKEKLNVDFWWGIT